MELEVSPEPDEAERAALAAALERARAEAAEAAAGSAWWRAGVEESVRDLTLEPGQAAAPRRSSPGAARA